VQLPKGPAPEGAKGGVWKTPVAEGHRPLCLLERIKRITQATERKGWYIGLTHYCAIQLRHEEAISVEPLEEVLVMTC
jgi:hypothetical protein